MSYLINTLTTIRTTEQKMLVVGLHVGIIQSILDFDAMLGKATPSVLAIVVGNRKVVKFFFGGKEILIPCFPSITLIPKEMGAEINFLLNLQSGRRVKETTTQFFEAFPHAQGAHLFAENVPENHALELKEQFPDKCIAGPGGVGLLVPGHLKLGAIGGVTPEQIVGSALLTPGNVAVISTSGGMVGELIRSLANAGRRMSFAACVGGERFPISSYTDFFLLAEADPETKSVLYYGELGGEDEYEIAELMKKEFFTKPLVAYVAGTVDESFPERTQFGHARALAQNKSESARAKREILVAAGAVAPDSFEDFINAFSKLPQASFIDPEVNFTPYVRRRASILSTRSFFSGKTLPTTGTDDSYVRAILTVIMPKAPTSDLFIRFSSTLFESLIDHGGNVSGAVTTMITARAGKDLVSSLAAGLLSIGPRFGGAVNAAAAMWREGVMGSNTPAQFVENKNKQGKLIQGIGHRKYRVGIPDPRVAALSQFIDSLESHPHYDFARAVEALTTAKNGSLILNVDGAIAAIALDILREEEGYTNEELDSLVETELFNAFFVIPRTVGFIGHFLEQKRNDEGLFRLPDDLLFEDPRNT